MSLTSGASCAKCGAAIERGAARCGACGAEVTARRPAGPPPRPPGRPATAERATGGVVTSASEVVTSARLPEATAPAANPFLATPVAPSEPFIEVPSNPFLAAPVAPAPRPVAAPAAESARVVAAASPAAPLRVDPNVVVPNIRDPHAEFRRGSWKKPLAFAVTAAAIVGGLSLLGGEKKPDATPTALAEPVKVRAGIGTSLPPHRATESDDLAPAKDEPPAGEGTTGGDLGRTRAASGESGFAKAFKEAAKR